MGAIKRIMDDNELNNLLNDLIVDDTEFIVDKFNRQLLTSISIPEPGLNFNNRGELVTYQDGDQKRLVIKYLVSEYPLIYESKLFNYKKK